jgi:hypothetical protein
VTAAAQTGPTINPPTDDVTRAQAIAGATAAVAVILVSDAPTSAAPHAVRAHGIAIEAHTTATTAVDRTMTGTATTYTAALAGVAPTAVAAAAAAAATYRSLTAGLRRPATSSCRKSSSGVTATAPPLDAGPTMGQPCSRQLFIAEYISRAACQYAWQRHLHACHRLSALECNTRCHTMQNTQFYGPQILANVLGLSKHPSHPNVEPRGAAVHMCVAASRQSSFTVAPQAGEAEAGSLDTTRHVVMHVSQEGHRLATQGSHCAGCAQAPLAEIMPDRTHSDRAASPPLPYRSIAACCSDDCAANW